MTHLQRIGEVFPGPTRWTHSHLWFSEQHWPCAFSRGNRWFAQADSQSVRLWNLSDPSSKPIKLEYKVNEFDRPVLLFDRYGHRLVVRRAPIVFVMLWFGTLIAWSTAVGSDRTLCKWGHCRCPALMVGFPSR